MENKDNPEISNFHEWWAEYSKSHPTYPLGGDIWMAAFAAWQYSELVTTNKLQKSEQG